MKKSFNYYLVKADRVAAWVLLITVVAFIVSGYGMTKGIITYSLASEIHNSILPLIMLATFTFHSFYAIRMALKRWGMWQWGKYLLIVAYLIFAASFVYLDQIYKKPTETESKTDQSTQSTSSSQSNTSTQSTSNSNGDATTSTQKIFTATELAKYDGQNGQPAYAAVDGAVYDLSKVFSSGSHFSHVAGKELTDAFYSEHTASQIKKYPVVGTFQN